MTPLSMACSVCVVAAEPSSISQAAPFVPGHSGGKPRFQLPCAAIAPKLQCANCVQLHTKKLVAWCAVAVEEEMSAVSSSEALDFVRSSRRNSNKPGAPVGVPVAYLTASATFEEMLDMIVEQRVHRVYIVDAERRPIAIATLTDLLYAIAGETPSGRLAVSKRPALS
jgi:signal-transduction protein with cAMP-binding, CBS, and nucleotidyltransferase domain